MRALLSITILSLLALPAFALPNPVSVPEPEMWALIGMGVVGLLLSRRRRK